MSKNNFCTWPGIQSKERHPLFGQLLIELIGTALLVPHVGVELNAKGSDENFIF
jgi:hypothetical protein